MHVLYFFSIENVKQKSLLKRIFELSIKAKVPTKCIYKCTKIIFCFFVVHKCINFAELWYIRFYILQLAYHYLCIIHKYVNVSSDSQYLQQYNLTCVEPSMGLTPCWIIHVPVYSIGTNTLRFTGLVTKSVVLLLVLTNN